MGHGHASLYWSLQALSESLNAYYPDEAEIRSHLEVMIEKLGNHALDFFDMAPSDPLVASMLLGSPDHDFENLIPTQPISSDFFTYLPQDDSDLRFTYGMQLSHKPADQLSLRDLGPLFILDEVIASVWSHRLLSENATQTRYGVATTVDGLPSLTWGSKAFVLDIMGGVKELVKRRMQREGKYFKYIEMCERMSSKLAS